MTRVDKFALAGGIITSLTAYLMWRNWDTAAAVGEALDPRTTPRDVERSLRNLREAR